MAHGNLNLDLTCYNNSIYKVGMGSAGNLIEVENSAWTFDGIADSFDTHIKSSVPFYKEAHDLGISLSDFFIRDGSVVYDIGCSTGTFLNLLWSSKKDKTPSLYGLDVVSSMIDYAEKNKVNENINFLNENISEYEFNCCSYITSFYSIQFIPPSVRQSVLNKVYQALEWGGAFLLFEKTRAPDARFQDISSQLYNQFKLAQGYTADEILSKQSSLKSVLEPFSTQGNLDLLKRAGFVDIMPVFKYICFEGFLCIK